jgi:hypothetical protein
MKTLPLVTKVSPGWLLALSVLATGALATLGCSSNCSGGTGATAPVGEIIGPPDNHCANSDGGLTIQPIGVCQVIDPKRLPAASSTCDVTFDLDAGAGATSDVDASVPPDAGPTTGYGPTMYGSAGNDDDCKYYVSWIATPIVEKADTYFTMTAIRLQDMAPATCAGVIPDVSLDNPNGHFSIHGVSVTTPSTEIAPGVYKVGPVRFDAPGTWTVRFHLFEECGDNLADSPHGHAAFYVKVP